MSEQPEIGQAIFGNPTGNYGTKEWHDALISEILREIGRVYWNKNQVNWDGLVNPNFEGVQVRPYYWGDDEEEEALPNLRFDFSEQEIRWYKYPGRGQSCTLDWSNDEWIEWFNKGLEVIRSNDTI